MLDSLLHKVPGLEACNFVKNRFQHRCFPVNIAKVLRTAFLAIEHLWWLLLNLLNVDLENFHPLICSSHCYVNPFNPFMTEAVITDLRCKSMDWFLYDNGLRHERVKTNFPNLPTLLLNGLTHSAMECIVLLPLKKKQKKKGGFKLLYRKDLEELRVKTKIFWNVHLSIYLQNSVIFGAFYSRCQRLQGLLMSQKNFLNLLFFFPMFL